MGVILVILHGLVSCGIWRVNGWVIGVLFGGLFCG